MRKKTLVILVLIAAFVIGIVVAHALSEYTHVITSRGTIEYREIIFSPLASMPHKS
jgi:hypothetical protein